MKKRGEQQFPEAGVVKEFPTYSVYSGTQPRPIVTGLWRRSSAEAIHEHAQSTQGRQSRHRRRAEHQAMQQENREHIARLRGQ